MPAIHGISNAALRLTIKRQENTYLPAPVGYYDQKAKIGYFLTLGLCADVEPMQNTLPFPTKDAR